METDMDEEDIRAQYPHTISYVAAKVRVHPQTLRHYEREGLIQPYRGKGKIRYFSDDDIEIIEMIRRLVNDLEVNLKGVDIILNMLKQIENGKREREETIRRMQEEHEIEVRRLKTIIRRLQSGQPVGELEVGSFSPSLPTESSPLHERGQ